MSKGRIGAGLLLLVLGAALLSLAWTPHDPTAIAVRRKLQAPSAAHWLGTDGLGRDVFSMLLVGAQNSLAVGLAALAIGLGGGTALGLWASARRGGVERLVMRSADFAFAFPALLTALLLTALYGPGLSISIVAIGLYGVPVFARLARAQANAVWVRGHVTAAIAMGHGAWHVTRRHVLPNIAGVLVVQATTQFALAILAEAALSYLGLGTQPPRPSWGRMLAEAQTQLFQAPQLAVWPGAAIALTVLGLNLAGDALRDRLDPRTRRRVGG